MTTVHLSRFGALSLVIGLLTALAGCGGIGSSKADVSGTIKLRGQAPKLAGLEIVFLSSNGTMVSTTINEDGTYKAEGVPTGETKIFFTSVSKEEAQYGAEAKAGGGRMKKPDDKTPPPKLTGNYPKTNPIREDLRDASTSKLSIRVDSGKNNVFDYDLP